MSYADRLKCLDLTTLELRRLHLDLIFCYKIVLAWWQSTFQIFLNLVMLARPEDMPTNCLNRIVTTVLATGFLPKELLVCGIPCQQV